MAEETSIGGSDVRFHTTAWSVVQNAQQGCDEALERLLEIYWKPVYFFVRRRGHDVEAAKDLTQSFIAKVLEREYLRDYDAERGKFRTFLLASLSHFLSKEHDRSRALKRGGHLNFVEAEENLSSAGPDPEKAFQRRWALEVMARAMERLKGVVSAEDVALLAGEPPASLGVEERKSRGRRVRERLRQLICEELLPTLESRSQLESEIQDLFDALRES